MSKKKKKTGHRLTVFLINKSVGHALEKNRSFGVSLGYMRPCLSDRQTDKKVNKPIRGK